LHGMIFAYRAIAIAAGTPIIDVYSTSFFNLTQYFDALLIGLLWTFGFIIMLNQRLNSEIVLKTKELEAMILDKDKFFSILAHDLRGPIATTVSMTELMIDGSYNFSKEDLLRLSVSLNKSAHSTNELLENLLEWTGLHRGLKTFSPIKTSFAELMVPFLPPLMETAKNKQITLNNDIPDDTAIFADPHMIQTVFRNLIINAIKFTPEGGCIKLSVHNNENGQMFFSIKDSGIGMDQDTLNTLFRIDFKNNRSGTNGEPSSGLGLLLCKEFIEKHGGSIWVESEVDKGSTFSFNLGKSAEQ